MGCSSSIENPSDRENLTRKEDLAWKKGFAWKMGCYLGDDRLELRHEQFTARIGRSPQLLMMFVPWSKDGGPAFPTSFCRFSSDRKAVPIITWEPWDPNRKWHPLLADIAAGREDDRLRDWAADARRFRKPVLIRFAHEMNGDWYPWCERKDRKQRASDYVTAWRRIREVFRAARATNVQFVWSPNFEPAERIERFYPGDEWVDWIGMDLYNQSAWPREPGGMIDPLLKFAEGRGKPVLLAEVGCAEGFTATQADIESRAWAGKSLWIDRLFEVVANRPAIRGLVWFDVRKEADWRINSSPEALASFRRGLVRLDARSIKK
jgi:hypothetical protein